MKISKEGLDLIKHFESFSPKACKCVETEKYYTIGYGHYGADVKPTDTMTRAQAEKLLKSDISSYEKKVDKYNKVYGFNQNEFDALVSFCYNVGNIDTLTANGTRSRSEISKKMLAYNKSGGAVLKGLTNRRKKEQELFNTPMSNKNNSIYYPRYNGTSNNLDVILKAIGVPDKYLLFWYKRKPLAKRNGIHNYMGSLSQNMKLIELAKNGILKRV